RRAAELEGVRARAAEDRAALLRDPHDLRAAERHDGALDDALPAPSESDELEVVQLAAREHERADDRVEPRAVAPAGEYADLHRVHHAASGRDTPSGVARSS